MDLEIKGKNAVVLASTKGLGKAIAKMLVQEGCNVAVCSRSKDSVKQTILEFENLNLDSKIIGKAADVSNADELDIYFDYVLAQFKNIDILVTNAGGPPSGEFEQFNDDDWYNAFDQNFMSVVRSVKRVTPKMKENMSKNYIH